MTAYEPLPKSFTKNGFQFEQRWRDGLIAIYRKRKSSWSEGRYSFEVFRIKLQKPFEIGGKLIPAKEAMPSNEEWGRVAWSYCDLASAMTMALSLTAKNGEQGDLV